MNTHKNTLLIVDDKIENIDTLISFLKEFDYSLLVSQSGTKALQIIEKQQPDLILLDVLMPGIDGFEVCKILKENIITQDIPVIFMTALADTEYKVKGFKVGAVDYITKPFQQDEVLARVETQLKISRLQLELKAANENLEEKVKERTIELCEANINLESEIQRRAIAEEELRDKHIKLQISEEKFRNIFANTNDGVIICGIDYTILLANMAFSNLVEYSIDEVIGSSIKQYLSFEKFEQNCEQNEQLPFQNLISTEYAGFKKDGTVIYVQIRSSFIDYEGSNATLAIIRDITEIKEEERKINTASVLAEEKERGRLAKELHDGLGPLLSASKIYIYNIQNRDIDENINPYIEKLVNITEEAITSVKEISNNISPHVLRNFGLKKAILTFISKLIICNKIQTTFYLDESKRYPDVFEITIYRAVTELLNNTIKYAQANNIYISMKEENNKLKFWYSDDGIGFDFEEIIQSRKGLGLFNILSRVNSLGGYVKFNSISGNGMSVYIEFNC